MNLNRYSFHLISRILLTATLWLLLSTIVGCGKRARPGSEAGVQAQWEYAMDLFERERYYRAQQVYREITLNFSGSALIDSAYYFLGRTSFELRDYLVAADEFNRMVSRFPSSALAGDAAYYEARSYFELAPSYRLDQQFTTKSFNIFQRYLEDYPNHALTDSAYTYMAKAREQLATKEYQAAEIYYQLGEYASAILYADAVLSNYYDTRQSENAQFLKARSYYKLRDWERARRELENYLQRFPDGRHVRRAQSLSERAAQKAEPPQGSIIE